VGIAPSPDHMIQAVRGTYDILPAEARIWRHVESEMRKIFEEYAFEEIRTPIFEATELFVRSVGEETDIVSKEMYTFVDKDEASLTLRPEGTAPVIRAFIEHRLNTESRMLKLYYIGAMFRRERPQKGRQRQFHQSGVEVLSATDDPAIEAEVIEMLLVYFGRLGIAGLELLVNSLGCRECRPAYIEELRGMIHERRSRLCPDCVRRGEKNPLRVFDCKMQSCQPILAELPTIADSLCDACEEHFDKFRGYLDARDIAFRVEKRLARGLDYYIRTTFEIVSGALGAQDTMVGGGRYDGLSEQLGGPEVKGFGFGMGLERLILSIPEPEKLLAASGPEYFLATIGDEAFNFCTLLARKLRSTGRRVYLDFDGRSLKSQMRLAGKLGARKVVIVGEDEIRSGKLVIRDMNTREQVEQTEDELISGAGGKAVRP
jgi:histidyl-tRNA synthetase